MARLTSAIFNKATGKVGNMILSNSYGNTVIARSVPTKTTNAPTNDQLAQRTLFSVVLAAALALSAIITQIFKPLKVYHSSYNSFMSSVIKAAIDNSVTTLKKIMYYANFTNGTAYSESLYDVDQILDSGAGDTEIDVKLNFTSVVPAGDPKLSDEIHYVVFSPSLKLSKVVNTVMSRQESDPRLTVITFNAPDNYIGFFFVDSVTGQPSDSKIALIYNSLTGVSTMRSAFLS